MSTRILLALLFVSCSHCYAKAELVPQQARVGKVIERFAGADTLAVAAVEISGQWITGVQKETAALLGPHANEVVNSPAFAMTLGFVESFRSAGAKELVIVLGTGDINPNTGPLFAITTESAAEAQAVKDLAQSLHKLASKQDPPLEFAVDESIVLVGQQATLKHYRERPARGQQLSQSMIQLLQTTDTAKQSAYAWLTVDPSDEPRRVIRELWPRLAPPFEKLTGEFIADRVVHFASHFRCPPPIGKPKSKWKQPTRIQQKFWRPQ